MGWARKLDLGGCSGGISNRSAISEAMVFRGLAHHVIGSRYRGSHWDRSGNEGCSFGESTVVVERRWRRGCMYPPFRLCCRLMHVAAFYLVFEMWFYVYDADGDGPYKRGSIWESALARLGSRTTIKSTCLQNEILG